MSDLNLHSLGELQTYPARIMTATVYRVDFDDLSVERYNDLSIERYSVSYRLG